MKPIGILLRISVFVIWTWLPVALSDDYQLQTDYRNIYNINPPIFGSFIFEQCKAESLIPMSVALGHLEQWTYMCSRNYFSTCQTQLPVAMTTKAQLNPYERDYVMSILNAWAKGGSQYLCNYGQTAIRQLMDSGGQTCLRVTADPRIRQCDTQLANLHGGTSFSDTFCRAWDDTFLCYINAINICPDDPLADFLWDFFENIMYMSPCRDSSQFTNAATTNIIDKNLAILLIILSSFLKNI